MRGTPSGERLSIVNSVRLLEVGTLVILGVVLVLVYGRKLEKNDMSFSKVQPSP